MPSILRKLALTVSAAALLLAALGCRHQELARRELQLRADSGRRTFDLAVRHERSRPQHLRQTAEAIRSSDARRAKACRDNAKELAAYSHRQWERWQQRQPAYWRELRRLTAGKPDRIERNAILLFY